MQNILTEHKFSSRILFLMEQIIEQGVCIGYFCADFVTNIYCLMCYFIHAITVKKFRKIYC